MTPVCELCGVGRALFVCSRCGKKVCSSCFKPSGWLCSSCHEVLGREAGLMELMPRLFPEKWLVVGSVLALSGLALLVIGLILLGRGALVLIPLPILVVEGLTALIVLILILALFLALSLALVSALRWPRLAPNDS